jgi:hypothetical protein
MAAYVAAERPPRHRRHQPSAGAGWLEGQSTVCLHSQLQAFAADTLRNDIGDQMRNVARRMSPEEIDISSRFHADRP